MFLHFSFLDRLLKILISLDPSISSQNKNVPGLDFFKKFLKPYFNPLLIPQNSNQNVDCFHAHQSKTIFEWFDRKSSDGQAKVGPWIQGIFSISRRIHESPACTNWGIHWWKLYRKSWRSPYQVIMFIMFALSSWIMHKYFVRTSWLFEYNDRRKVR